MKANAVINERELAEIKHRLSVRAPDYAALRYRALELSDGVLRHGGPCRVGYRRRWSW